MSEYTLLNREVYASSQIEYYVDILHKRYSVGFLLHVVVTLILKCYRSLL